MIAGRENLGRSSCAKYATRLLTLAIYATARWLSPRPSARRAAGTITDEADLVEG